MGPDRIHHRALNELADVTAGPFLVTYPSSWVSGEALGDWNLASVLPVCRKGMTKNRGNYRPVGPTSAPGKRTEKMILGTKFNCLLDKGKGVDVAFLDFSLNWARRGWRAALQKGSCWGYCWAAGSVGASSVPWQTREQTTSCGN